MQRRFLVLVFYHYLARFGAICYCHHYIAFTLNCDRPQENHA